MPQSSKIVTLTFSFFPQYYLTLWYCRHEIQFRQALFYSGASLAGAFSGLLAYAISMMDGVGGLAGWRWIFILEGLVTVVVAVISFSLLYDFPETAEFLTEEERAFVVFRLKYGQRNSGKQIAEVDHFEWKYVRQAFMDWQIYVHLFLYWGVCMMWLPRSFDPHLVLYRGLTITDRLPNLRHFSISTNNHQGPWVCV